jgi:hypothetical protein
MPTPEGTRCTWCGDRGWYWCAGPGERYQATCGCLPPGFKVLEDGPGRHVLCDERTDDPAPVFADREEAVKTAWRWWREIYEPECETHG